jgi:hypothetical protein
MLSTELEYICRQLECFLQGGNAFDSVGIPLYRIGMLSTGLDSVGIPLYRVGMLSVGWECFRQCWNTFVLSWNAFDRVGIPLY